MLERKEDALDLDFLVFTVFSRKFEFKITIILFMYTFKNIYKINFFYFLRLYLSIMVLKINFKK